MKIYLTYIICILILLALCSCGKIEKNKSRPLSTERNSNERMPAQSGVADTRGEPPGVIKEGDKKNTLNYLICQRCGGTGRCQVCDGTGRNIQGDACPVCDGSQRCFYCNGQGSY